MLHNFLKASNTLYCMMDILNILLIVMHDKLGLKINEVALDLIFINIFILSQYVIFPMRKYVTLFI